MPHLCLGDRSGEMLFAVPPPWHGRQAHLFKLGYDGGTLSPDAEINIPDGLNRGVSGLLVAAPQGETLICHRGTFTAFRGRVPRQYAFEHFHDWLMEVDDDGKTADVIAVSSTNSTSIANDIAEFLFKVKRLKEQRKAELGDGAEGSGEALDDEDESGAKWRGQEEFEGTKSYTRSQDTCEYQYLHGPLCNALHRKLDELVEGHPELKVGKHQVDLALVEKATDKAKVILRSRPAPRCRPSFTPHLVSLRTTSIASVMPTPSSSWCFQQALHLTSLLPSFSPWPTSRCCSVRPATLRAARARAWKRC